MDASSVDLIAVQCFVNLTDYLTEEAFKARIRALFEKVATVRSADRPAIVVFPEMLGTFLGFMGQRKRIEGARTTDEAMSRIGKSMLMKLLATMAKYRTTSMTRALLLILAPEVHHVYFETFSEMARTHGVHVVAGSALLPRHAGNDNDATLVPLDSQIYNTSYTFDPQGRCVGVTRKVNLVPTQEDILDLSAGAPSSQPIVPTAAGPLATAICYDGFCEPHTAREPNFVPLVRQYDQSGAMVIACPSANPWAWDKPWVFNDEGENQLRSEQWMNEGLAASMKGLRNVRHGINPMLLGIIMDHGFDGRSHIFSRRGSKVEILAAAQRCEPSPEAEEVIVATVPAMLGHRVTAT